ncbi:MAG TPA: nitroreductase family deazaflavin-dependent oxidoreductase [Candidatus Limnocylindria bacterium]|jgi:deazaflavin-dependent oxidoreductase (nitroreductase family)|nr:nitroreductase family deazaflavin-dependent oxidoreductase [Candidatus Limnocylindria bacterium]
MNNHLIATEVPDERISRALSRGHTIDITTTGRRSGQPRRIELVFHNIDGHVVISGLPGRRDWYANLLANPRLTFHLKGAVKADLPATARPIVEPVERQAVMTRVAQNWGRTDLERMLQRSPLVEVTFDQAA